jgi:hypothetical protein
MVRIVVLGTPKAGLVGQAMQSAQITLLLRVSSFSILPC